MEHLRFEDMQLSKEIYQAVLDMGFEEATPIQSQAIPLVKAGKDIIGQSQTGTGKTAAFGIPCLERTNSLPYQRTGHPGQRRIPETAEIQRQHPRCAYLRRTTH